MLMVRHTVRAITCAPLYIQSFRLVQPHTLVEAEKFDLCYTGPSQITNTPDKLRWYRYQKAHGSKLCCGDKKRLEHYAPASSLYIRFTASINSAFCSIGQESDLILSTTVCACT